MDDEFSRSQTLLLGIGVSAAVAFLATLLLLRLRPRPMAQEAGSSGRQDASYHTHDGPRTGDRSDREAPPVEPGIDPGMPAHLPNHFSEDLIIPGITETGQDVAEQDDTAGRSPEGV